MGNRPLTGGPWHVLERPRLSPYRRRSIGGWQCCCSEHFAWGQTPQDAYTAWKQIRDKALSL